MNAVDVVSTVVTTLNETACGTTFTARAPLPVVHVNVVDAAAMAPVTVSTSTWVDVVTAVTVPAELAHVGVLLAMKTLLFDVIVIVSETSLTPAVPVANAVTGTMINLSLVGARSTTN